MTTQPRSGPPAIRVPRLLMRPGPLPLGVRLAHSRPRWCYERDRIYTHTGVQTEVARLRCLPPGPSGTLVDSLLQKHASNLSPVWQFEGIQHRTDDQLHADELHTASGPKRQLRSPSQGAGCHLLPSGPSEGREARQAIIVNRRICSGCVASKLASCTA